MFIFFAKMQLALALCICVPAFHGIKCSDFCVFNLRSVDLSGMIFALFAPLGGMCYSLVVKVGFSVEKLY